MYEIILPIHVFLGFLTLSSIFMSMFKARYAQHVFYGSLTGVSLSGLVMVLLGSSTLWVCVRLVSLVAISLLFKYYAVFQFDKIKN